MLVSRLKVCWKERWWRGRGKRKVLPFGLGLRLSLEMCPELLVMEGFSPAILPAEGSDFFLLWVKLTNWQVWNADHGKEVSTAGRTHLWAHHCHWAWMAKPALLQPPTLQAGHRPLWHCYHCHSSFSAITGCVYHHPGSYSKSWVSTFENQVLILYIWLQP